MRNLIVSALLVGSLMSAVAVVGVAQQSKAQEIAASFNKHKNSVKEKYGVKTVKFKDVRAEPVVRQNASEYAGLYEVSGLGYVINLQISSDGRIHGTGSESSRAFKLENAKLDGALLTASKVYQDGATEKFEGVFINRTERNSPTHAATTTFGLGVILNQPVQIDGLTYQRMFYQLKR